jgi:hypothetical protein
MIVGRQAHDKLRLHPKVTDAVKYTRGAVETQDILAAYFGVKKYLVGDGFVDSSTEGQAESLGFIWGKHCVAAAHAVDAERAHEQGVGRLHRALEGRRGRAAPRVHGEGADARHGQGSTFVKVGDRLQGPLHVADPHVPAQERGRVRRR